MFSICCGFFYSALVFVRQFVAMRIYKAAYTFVLSQLCLPGLAAQDPNILNFPILNLTSVSNWTHPQLLEYTHPTGFEASRTDPTLNSVLPSDPFLYRVPQSSQIITFSHYSRTLNREDVLGCLLKAALEVIKEINLGHDGPIDTNEIQAGSGHSLLIFHPDPRLMWGMWGTAITGISSFLTDFEFVDCDFDLQIIGYRATLGSGHLVYL